MADAQEAVDGGRRWYHLRPEPRRRSDLMGFNSTWWMVLIWARSPPLRRPSAPRRAAD